MSALPRIYAVIPTFNEEPELARCLASLHSQEGVEIIPLVVNAGRPLSTNLAAQCTEVKVEDSCFWTCCTQTGFDSAKERGAEIVMMANSDIELLPGTAALLVEQLRKAPDCVFAPPGYIRDAAGRLRLQFSRDLIIPFLMHNYLRRDWTFHEEAPDSILRTGVAGGQGVIFSAKYLDRVRLDPKNFPHYRGDHAFWAAMKKAGARLFFVSKAGIVNQRPLADGSLPKGLNFRAVWHYMTSEYSAESVITMWRYRRETLPLPAAIPSFILMVPGAWCYRILKAVVTKVGRQS